MLCNAHTEVLLPPDFDLNATKTFLMKFFVLMTNRVLSVGMDALQIWMSSFWKHLSTITPT